MTPNIDPIATALLVVRHLDALSVPHTIGGSIASSFAGEPRSTIDIDIVVALEERHDLRDGASILGVTDLLDRALREGEPEE